MASLGPNELTKGTYSKLYKRNVLSCTQESSKQMFTHWPLGNLIEFNINNFQDDFSDWWLRYLIWNWPQMNATKPHWWLVNIGSGNGLMSSGNKPLPEPTLTQICVVIAISQVTIISTHFYCHSTTSFNTFASTKPLSVKKMLPKSC